MMISECAEDSALLLPEVCLLVIADDLFQCTLASIVALYFIVLMPLFSCTFEGFS